MSPMCSPFICLSAYNKNCTERIRLKWKSAIFLKIRFSNLDLVSLRSSLYQEASFALLNKSMSSNNYKRNEWNYVDDKFSYELQMYSSQITNTCSTWSRISFHYFWRGISLFSPKIIVYELESARYFVPIQFSIPIFSVKLYL